MMRSFRAYSAVLLGLGAAILGVACSDIATEPVQPASRITPSPIGQFDRGGSPTAVNYSATGTFTLRANQDTYVQIGPHFLYVPANSVCDPRTSGYGVAYWTKPCATLPNGMSITVKATASLANGHPIVTFDQHLRFKPGNDGRFAVMLYMRDDRAGTRSRIFWCPDAEAGATAYCVDETGSLNPGEIQSRYDERGGFIYRRIEHFSGYNVTAGDGGDSTSGGGL